MEGKPHIKCSVVILSSDKKSDLRIVRGYDGNPLCYDLVMDSVQLHNNRNSTISYHHIYFTSDEKIKEGDHFLTNRNGHWELQKCQKVCEDGMIMSFEEEIAMFQEDTYFVFRPENCKKIIATNDENLVVNNKTAFAKLLPQPSQQFIEKYIEEYNKGNIINEILVEVEEDKGYCTKSKNDKCKYGLLVDCGCCEFGRYKLKLDSQNQITIRKQKNSWNKSDISRLVRKLKSLPKERQLEITDSVESFDEWIEENL